MAGTVRKAEKTWCITYDGQSLLVDDMTWAELEAVEQSTGVPWSLLNPLRNSAVGQALLAVLLVRQGKTDEEAREAVRALHVRDFKGVFTRVDDDRPTYYGDDALPVDGPKAPTGAPTAG